VTLHNDLKKNMSGSSLYKNSLKKLVLFRKQYLVTKLKKLKHFKMYANIHLHNFFI